MSPFKALQVVQMELYPPSGSAITVDSNLKFCKLPNLLGDGILLQVQILQVNAISNLLWDGARQ